MDLSNLRSILTILLVFYFPVSFADGNVTFSSTGKIKLEMTGNTLGLSGELDANGPGTQGSIHTFTSLDENSVDDVPPNLGNPWGAFTTPDFNSNGSSGNLNIPTGTRVLYAELVWGGSYRYVDDVTSELDSDISLTTPASSFDVSPSVETRQKLDILSGLGYQVAYYIRSADVTQLVSDGGSGSYAVSGVPGTQHEAINSLNALGWALIVVIEHPVFECQTIKVQIGADWIDEFVSSETTFSGFATRNTMPLFGRLLVGALEGDADSGGDNVYIKSPDNSEFYPLSSANNPLDNFFASQINKKTGSLDTTGTWGAINHDALSGLNSRGGRQGWDITGVDLDSNSGLIGPGQEQIVIKASTSGDAFVLAFLALEVEVDPVECPPEAACNVNVVPAITEDSRISHEACEVLMLGPDFIAADGSKVSANSGWEIELFSGFQIETGAIFEARVCGQSLCMTSPDPMPYGCHSCVIQICDNDAFCCSTEFDRTCLEKVGTVCGLVCE